MKYDCIVVVNTVEAFSDIILNVSSLLERKQRLNNETRLDARALYWENGNILLITSEPVNPLIIQQSRLVFDGNINNVSPSFKSMSLSRDILSDHELLEHIIKIVKENPHIKIESYAFTKDFKNLLEVLNKKTFFVERDDNLFITQYLDSKIGSRLALLQVAEIKNFLPNSIIVNDHKELKKVCEYWKKTHGTLPVIKANKGESGWGTLILDDLDELKEVENTDFEDGVWKNELLLVEEKIKTKISPSIEYFLYPDKSEYLYTCSQRLVNGTEFEGVILGSGYLSESVEEELKRIGFLIAENFRKIGYRGFFDIDFVLDAYEKPFIIETNMRRTGGTHIYKTLQKIFGSHWEEEGVALSNDNIKITKEIDEIIKSSNNLFNKKQKKRRVSDVL